jgi:hypothetical protein
MTDAQEKENVQEKAKVKDRIGGATQVAFSFDCTGSMRSCIGDVRQKLEETCEEMFADIPGLKVGLIAHGDYCDGDNCISVLKLTSDRAAIYNFIRNAPDTSGGDAPECYELALHEARNLGWSEDNTVGRALVLIGDECPHPPEDPQNVQHLDWREELQELKKIGVRVYPLQCLFIEEYDARNQFWSQIADYGGTHLMQLNEFCESAITLQGVVYAAAGAEMFDKYEKKVLACASLCSADVRARTAILRSESATYDSLKSGSSSETIRGDESTM